MEGLCGNVRKVMKQRDIHWANLDSTLSPEQRGTHPVVILSGNAMNNNLVISIIYPLSTKIKHYADCLVLKKDSINHLTQDSEVIVFRTRTISQKRLRDKIGEITEDQLDILQKGLMEILTY